MLRLPSKHLFKFSVLLGSLSGCSTSFSPQTCSIDSDCGDGLVCETGAQTSVCVPADEAPLRIGQSAPVSGTNQALGTQMKLGIELAFDEVNANGGIRGRKLELVFRDDAYEADLAEAATRALIDVKVSSAKPRCPSTATPAVAGQTPVSMTALERGPNAVLAMLGNVGTPTSVRAAPVAVETGTLFFGAFTGADTLLRDDKCGACGKYIFNIRGSYGQEAQATVEYFVKKGVNNFKNMISFDQNDSFGQAGYDGLLAAYRDQIGSFPGNADPTNPIFRARYTRNDDNSVPAQVVLAQNYLKSLLQSDSAVHNVGVFMTDTYGAGGKFIESIRRWQFDGGDTTLDKPNRLKLFFSNVSFVGPDELSARLLSGGSVTTPNGPLPLTTDVVVSQVVPNYQSDSSEIVVDYNRLIAARGATPGFTSLEGYVAARVFIAGLEAHKGPFTPDALVETFEQLPDLSLGLGASAGFAPTNHQYSRSVWGTTIESDGTFKNLYFWSEGLPIQFFE